jgi:hypothetical protein
MTGRVEREGVSRRVPAGGHGAVIGPKRKVQEYRTGRMGMTATQTLARHQTEGAAIMRGKLMFITGLAAGFVLGSRAGREKYEEIRVNAKKVWEHPTVQEAAGVAQAQATKLYTESKDKLQTSKLGEKLHVADTGETDTATLIAPTDSLAGSNSKTTGTTY